MEQLNPVTSQAPRPELLPVLASVWTVQIVRALREKSWHFSGLKRRVAGISAKVLTTRLRTLENSGLVERRVIPSSPPTVRYLLTEFGTRISSVVDQLEETKNPL